uniref:Ribosomal protein L6 n=1 Tax=Phaeophyceae sp. TaxID=2249243 RepID=A0A8E5BHU7_9PHAE|nr:ribosomal protein L6 [Phaeophyceae sp.]
MSRIGKVPLRVPSNVQVNIDKQGLTISGLHGKLFKNFSKSILVEFQNNILYVSNIKKTRFTNQLHGLTRTLINNMIIGVSQKFERILQLHGVGYRAKIKENELVLNLGYSHPVILVIPKEINIIINNSIEIIITGLDKQLVGQVAAKIRSKRPPEPYNGKGILYKGEIIKRKVGKSGK